MHSAATVQIASN